MNTLETNHFILNQLEADLRREDSLVLNTVSVIPGEKRPDTVEAQIGAQQLKLDYSLETGLLSFNEHELRWFMQDDGNEQWHLLAHDLRSRLQAVVVREFNSFNDFSFNLDSRARIRNNSSLYSLLGQEIFWPFKQLEESDVGRQLLKPRIADYVDLQQLPLTLQPKEAIALVNYADNFRFRHAVVIRPISKRKVVLSRHELGVQYQGDCEMISVSTEESEHIRQVSVSSRRNKDTIPTNKDSTAYVLGNIDFDALQQWCPVTYVRGDDGAMRVRE